MRRALITRMENLDYSGAEALNTICSNIAFSGKNLRKIVTTSCEASDGKSYLTMCIAQNFAKRGKRVVLVDADLRRSTIVKKLGLEVTGELCGLSHYLTGHNPMEDILYMTNMEGIYVIPAGHDVKNPVPLLDSEDFRNLLNALSQSFDMVFVDAPPVGLVIDAAEIAKACDGSVLILHYNKTRRRDILAAKKQLASTGCAILGCIINKVSFDSIASKKYYNRTYYSHYSDGYYRRQPAKKQ